MFLYFLSGVSFAEEAAPKLSDEEFAKAKQIFFSRCAGCHGTLRKGATGPNLEPAKTRAIPHEALATIISEGTPGGMPSWKDVLTHSEVELLSIYLQMDAPQPPEWGMEDIRESWKLLVPVDKRPTKPTKRNWQNFFGVVQRDIGKVTIIDGDTKEILTTLNTGFAVHILRISASGRYMYSIGRDGKATMIDLWADPPNIVAEIKTGMDARSIDTSKYTGKLGNFMDKYAVVGNYWPPHYVIMKGDTLEPIKIVSSRSYTVDTGEFHPEPRVAAIIASHHAPEWVLNVKETGYVLLVDYSKLEESGTVIETKIPAERFLHDGGWDSSKRYFMDAANMKNKIVAVDTVDRKVAAVIETGNKPHPGRGANWDDPKYGPVWATPHIGEPMVAVIGTDPVKHKEYAWKVVRKLKVDGNGLFIKTHPNSDNIWVDNTLTKDADIAQTLTVYSKKKLDGQPEHMRLAEHGKVVHMEYNKNGDEMWVSVWDKEGEIVIIDDKTRMVKQRIKLATPTGKFNVYNTMKDVY